MPCNTLQHTAAHCNSHATHCNTLQHAATHCNTLQHTATHWNIPQLQLPTTHCNAPQHPATHLMCKYESCNKALCCNHVSPLDEAFARLCTHSMQRYPCADAPTSSPSTVSVLQRVAMCCGVLPCVVAWVCCGVWTRPCRCRAS